jgi:signal transduction histidine kinase
MLRTDRLTLISLESRRLPYTDGNDRSAAMNFVWARNITERTVLRGLVSGFALVLLLLGVAGFIAVRRAREIQADAEELVREELVIARLLNEAQAEEATITSVLHHLVRGGTDLNDTELLRDLAQADDAVGRTTKAAEGTSDSVRWRELHQSVRAFTDVARAVIRTQDHTDESREYLFALHAEVLRDVKALIASSTGRASKVDQLLARRSRTLASQSSGLLSACFLLALLCAVLTVRMAANAIRRMEWQSAELNQVSWQMIRTQEDAARRFSHELHDELGQSLAAIKANLTGARPEDFVNRRADCIHLVDDAIANVRELSQLLRPVMLDDFGLDAAIRWLGEKFQQRTGIVVSYESTLGDRLADELETHLFRISQEALTNVARHSGARRVHIKLYASRSTVHLTITDNGRGLAVPEVKKSPSMGMVGMRARARQAGGELVVSTPFGGGLTIDVALPAAYAPHDVEQENPSTVG